MFSVMDKISLLSGCICIFLCYVLFLIPSQITPLFALIFYYFGENLVRPFLKSLILTNSPQNLKTTVLSLISGFSTLFKFPFVYLLSYLIDFNFTYGIMFMVGLKLLVFLVGGGYILRSNLVESLEINT